MELAELLWIVIPAFIFLDGVLPWVITVIAITYAFSGDTALQHSSTPLSNVPHQVTEKSSWVDTNTTTGWN